MLRKMFTSLTLLTLLWGGAAVAESSVKLLETTDLRVEGEMARERDLPILMMFSAEHCPWCVQVKEDYLKPMLISGDYTDKVIIRVIELDGSGDLIDFAGQRVDSGDFARDYAAFVTPTLVYVDGRGKILTPNMVGMGTPDYYGYYIDEAINASLTKLRPSGTRLSDAR